MREIEVDGKISSLIAKIPRMFPNNKELWFRGQSKYKYRLIPSIFRQGENFDVVSYDEAGMYREFIRRYPEHATSHKSVYEWLTLMQHYGLPTRLLDWTTNLLVALYFCCEKDNDEDGAIFVLDPSSLIRNSEEDFVEMQILSKDITDFYMNLFREKRMLFEDDAKINGYTIKDINSKASVNLKFTCLSLSEPLESFLVKKRHLGLLMDGDEIEEYEENYMNKFSSVIPFKTPQLNSRIKAQHGLFTIHGGKYFLGHEFIEYDIMEKNYDLAHYLTKIRIKNSDKEALMHELELSGIREAALFPEMEYQAKDIKSKFSDSKKYVNSR